VPSINEVLSLIKKNYPFREVYGLLTEITKYHRIQGSRDLWSAVDVVKNYLEENGLETRVYKIENGLDLGLYRAPTGWRLVYGEVVVRENNTEIAKLNTIDRPTLVIAHSPSGSGKAGIEFVKLENIGKAGGKVALTNDPPYLVYKFGLDYGLEAIAWYGISRHPRGVPYTGYHIEPSEERDVLPGFTLPEYLVERIHSLLNKGSRVTIEWNIETRYEEYGLPVLEACIGSGEEAIVATAHICHPTPGAHDNASGSAVLAGSAVAVKRLWDKLGLSHRICFYWIPEYTGTIALFIKRVLRENVIANLNVDMIGSRQEATGSVLHHIRASIVNQGFLTPATWLSLEAIYRTGRTFHGQYAMGSTRYDSAPYGNGSDHDVFNIAGVEGVMYNEWPSLYYHTDLDTPDTIGYNELYRSGVAVSLSLVLASKPSLLNNIEDYVRSYYSSLLSWYVMESCLRGRDYGFVVSGVREWIARAIDRSIAFIRKSVVEKECCTEGIYRGYTSIPLRCIALELGTRYYRLVTSRRSLSLLVSTALPVMLRHGLGIDGIIKTYLAEQILDPKAMDIECFGYKGIECLRKILGDVISWLSRKKLIV